MVLGLDMIIGACAFALLCTYGWKRGKLDSATAVPSQVS